MDFGRSAIHKLINRMDFLHHTSFDVHEGRARPDTSLMCMDDSFPDRITWNDLAKEQRGEVLNRYIDWTHFEPEQVDKIIDNIASGKERIHWFDDVPMGWRGVSERAHREWLEFEKLPEEEQLRETARWMKRSKTLGGDGVTVNAKWEEMTDEQRRDVIFYQLCTAEGSNMPYGQWQRIIKEELGYWPGEGPVKPDMPPTPFPSEQRNKAESPLERVERQIRGLKAEPGFTVPRTRDVVLDGGAIGGVDYEERVDGWEGLYDRDQFAELVRLDWQGVGPEDRRRLLGREVDLDRLPPAMLRPFLDRDPARPRPPSPSEILDNPRAYLTPEAGNGHGHDHGPGRGR